MTRPTPGAGVTATWNYTLWTLVTLFAVLDIVILSALVSEFTVTRDPALAILVLLGIAASAARLRVCWLLRDAPTVNAGGRWPSAAQTIGLLAPAVVSWAFAFGAAETAVFAAAQLWLSGTLLTCFAVGRARWGMLGILLVFSMAPVLLHAWRENDLWALLTWGQTWLLLFYGGVMPAMLYTSLWMWKVVRALDESRHLAAELAVTQERLRFAADLHDIQGHHLQVIALKAELAERTLEPQPAVAAAQVGEIRLIAKEAMEETRSLVAGLRTVELRDELENASEVLTLSGAECALDVSGLPGTLATERVLAFVVREGTTNILRHSTATHARIALGPVRGGFELVMTNDGVDHEGGDGAGGAGGFGGAGAGAGSAAGSAAGSGAGSGPGSGLAGLRERVAAVGGTLHVGAVASTAGSGRGTLGSRGTHAPATFELRVWVPGE